MPALPNVNHVVRNDYHFSYSEDVFAKCREFYFYTGTGPSISDLNAWCASIQNAFNTDLAALMGTLVSVTLIEVTDLTSPTAAVGSNAAAVPGTRAGTSLTADTCVLESNHIARRFRGGHPRIYWPFGTNPDLADAQTFHTAFVTAVAAGLNSYRAAIAAAVPATMGAINPVAVSFYQGFTVHTGVTGRARNVSTVRLAPLVDIVNSRTVHTGIASQRRRLLKLA